jgi:hypothetical protein
MFKALKEIPWNKIKFKRKLRSADELFSSGKIFNARDKELDNVLKELTTNPVINPTIHHREIIRAITVLTVKNNRDTRYSYFLLVVLTVLALLLAWQQVYYAQISTRDIRLRDLNSIQEAKEYCKNNPDAKESGTFYIDSGKPAPCSEVLKLNK